MILPRFQSLGLGVIGIVLLLAGWELIGQNRLAGMSWPPFSSVVVFLLDPSRQALLGRALGATLISMASGYGLGALAGLSFSMLSRLVPALRAGADRTTAVIHAIPSIALAPIFIVLLSREAAPTAIATLNAFFVFYVAGASGFFSATRTQGDLMSVLGASRLTRFIHVDAPAAVPAIVTGMKLAVPASLIGAIIGEWFGAPRGLGILIVNAMQNFQIPLLWSVVVLAATTSLVLFSAMTILERFVHERFR
jgi:ABC-type nitrate/sulfonate/bicarbonate transport system permease component